MNERKRVLLLLSVMAFTVLIVAGLTAYLLYSAAFNEQTERLTVSVQSQARLIEAVALFATARQKGDRNLFTEDTATATLSQIKEAHRSYRDFGETGEFTLARREENQIVFLLSHRHRDLDQPKPVPFDSNLAEPMRMALSGKSGAIVDLDYRGKKVLAAYEPVGVLNLGIVAKIDMDEIRAPFVKAYATALAFGFLMIFAGALFFLRVTNPIIRHLEEHAGQMERAATSLRESEERLRKIIEKSVDAILVVSPERVIRFSNPAAEVLFGRTSQELIGSYLGFPFSGEATMEIEIVRPNREQVTSEMRVAGIEWEGKPAFLTSIRDMTERKRSQERILHLNRLVRAIRNVNQLIAKEKNRERLIQGACENLVETRGLNSAWIALMDKSGRIYHVADAGLGERSLPLKQRLESGDLPQCAQKALEKPGIIHVDDVGTQCADCSLAPCFQGESAFSVRLEYGGLIYGLLTSSVPAPFGRELEEQSLFQEVGDDIAFGIFNLGQEEELRNSREFLNAILDRVPDPIFIKDEQHRWILVNEKFCEITGAPREELLGKSDHDYFRKEEADLFWKVDEEVFNTGKENFSEESITSATTGTPLFLDTKKALYQGAHGEKFIVGIGRDVTAQKSIQKQFFQSQKLEVVARMSGSIAHDFNNLMTTVIGNAELILMGIPKDDPIREYVGDIKKAGESATSLTRQLLAFSRRQILQPIVLNTNEVVSDMDKMLRRLIGEDIEVETILASDLGYVEADPGQLEQVIMNLAVNAGDAMPEGGKLVIETANVELDDEYSRAHIAVTPGSYVMLAVSDTGIGMTREVQSQIFEPFFTTKEKGKGTGLGLSTVYGIVKQSNGNIWVYSEAGKGTTFKVYLPRTEKGEHGPAEKKTEPVSLKGSETILLVEDEEMLRKMVVKALEAYGYTVLDAPNGQEALRVCQEYDGTIHLMLTDVVMPGMSGRELAGRVTSMRPDLKILFMSGYTKNAIVHHGILDKGIDFFQKPFTPEGLAEKARQVLDAS
jgi:PAS domain S-box-containing protein